MLAYAILIFPFFCSNKTKLEIYRNAISEKIQQKLKKKYLYKNNTDQFSPDDYAKKKLIQSFPKKIWFLWLQGIEQAPQLVKNNFEIINNIVGKDRVVLITWDNLFDYITLPEFIEKKYDKKIISNTHLSDIIRLELLARYGGVWCDSTLMMTSDEMPKYLEDSDFFVPQILKPGRDGHAVFVSNWLIASKPENLVIMRLLELLYMYWQDNDVLVDYFIFHHLLEIVFLEDPDSYNSMIPIDNSQMHSILISVIKDQVDNELLQKQIGLSDFQKLSNKVTGEQKRKLLEVQQIRLKETIK